MKSTDINLPVKIVILWYIFIYISTELLSLFHAINRANILILNFLFVSILFYVLRHRIDFSCIRNVIQYHSYKIIILILFLTFIQGFFSAPSTTDSMVYHIPRVLYWIQNQTVEQYVIRNAHDFMPPFAEFILLHLYSIFGNDRMLFLSQWLAFVAVIYLTGLISMKIGLPEKLKRLCQLVVAVLPIGVLQASSSQTDMVTAVFIMLSLYFAFSLLENFSYRNLFLFGVSLGLGSLVKSSFYVFSVIPIGFLVIELFRRWQVNKLFLSSIAFGLAVVIQIPFFLQNLYLYGSIFGTRLLDKNSVYSNDVISFNGTVSNLIRNIFIQIPFPFINNFVENLLIQVHKLLNISINDPRTTFENSAFHIQQIIFPQEDIAGNPFHLMLIFLAGIYILKHKQFETRVNILYILTVFSFVLFSVLFKWQQQHPRLEIPFFIIGSIASVKILESIVTKLKIFKISLFLSVALALLFVFLNVSHPFISYSLIYKDIKKFSTPLSVVPELFITKPRIMQYFNSRYYWYEPYANVVQSLPQDKIELNLDLKDGFEYPLIVLLNSSNKNYYLVSKKEITNKTIIIRTTEYPDSIQGYNSNCFETPVKYGYACLLRKTI